MCKTDTPCALSEGRRGRGCEALIYEEVEYDLLREIKLKVTKTNVSETIVINYTVKYNII